MRAQEASAVGDDVVHDDDRLLRRVVDGRVVRPWRTDVEPRRQLAVEGASDSRSVPGEPSRCAFTQYARISARTVRALDRHPQPHLLREGLRRVDLLDADDAITVVDVVERVAEPLGVEHDIEGRRHGRVRHGAEATAARVTSASAGV